MGRTVRKSGKQAPATPKRGDGPPKRGDGPVTVELTAPQVARVLREAAEDTLAALFSSVGRGTLADRYELLLDSTGRELSKSLLQGLLVLSAFPPGEMVPITHLAARLGMNSSTTHRYVRTLLAAGLLEQSEHSRAYGLVAA